jgi:hypothetical protein
MAANRNQGTARTPGSSGRTATGRSAAPGTQVTSLNQNNAYNPANDRQKDLNYGQQELDMERRNRRQTQQDQAEFDERRERNISAPRQIRDLNAQMKMTDRQASAQENTAAQQAAANIFAAKQQAEAQKFSATKQAISQLGAAKAGADAQMFAAKQDAQARLGVAGMEQKASLKKTASEERSNFKNMLGNLAASMGEKGSRQREAVISAATTAAGNATAKSDSDADRMADMYKSIMNTYNTGNQQFRYW